MIKIVVTTISPIIVSVTTIVVTTISPKTKIITQMKIKIKRKLGEGKEKEDDLRPI